MPCLIAFSTSGCRIRLGTATCGTIVLKEDLEKDGNREADKARATIVEPGVYRDGQVEIRSGVAAGARVAVDGAGFLSDGAAVRVQEGGA